MDRLKIARKVRKHASTMNRKSIGDRGLCMYRTRTGDRCFIGALIPDRLYRKSMEFTPVKDLPDKVLKHIGVETNDDLEFLTVLQKIHDYAESIEEARGKLDGIIQTLEKKEKK